MILKNIILPERFGDYYLFSQTRLGIDISKTKIKIAVVEAKGKRRILKRLIEETISQDTSQDYDERVASALARAVGKVKYYDTIITALPSSKVVFKELVLPFAEYEKISAIIGFEVEPYLPFPVDRAYIDFIITKQSGNETTVMVAAVKHEYVNEHMALLERAGIEPTKVTIDMFELFGLFTLIPRYQSMNGPTVLLDVGLYTTRIGYIVNNALVGIRMLPRGMASVAKTNEDLEHIYRFGIEQDMQLPESFERLLEDIQFTIAAFKSASPEAAQTMLLLFGDGASIKGIQERICQNTPYECHLFELKRLLENGDISFAINNIDPAMITSIAIALSSPVTQSFNILPRTVQQEKLIVKQLITAAILFLALFTALSLHAFFQLRKLRTAYRISENQARTQLRTVLNVNEKNLGLAVSAARNEIEKEENIWFSLSPQNRISFLKYLEELSTLIDRENVGLDLNKLSLTRDSIVLEGSVPDWPDLETFRRELRRSKIFSLDVPPQHPNFKTIRLIVSRNAEEY